MQQGCVIPNWLVHRNEISPAAKLLYARLAHHARRVGRVYVHQRRTQLEKEIGVSQAELDSLISELTNPPRRADGTREYQPLIKVTGSSLRFFGFNKFVFLDHPWQRESSDN